MFTRMKWQPPTVPQVRDAEVSKYLRDLNKSISDYLLSLESPGGTVLDELKTWTPADVSGATLSFTSVTGTYLIVGRMVIAWGALTYPATASGANAQIGGLPLAVKNEAAARSGGIIAYSTETTAARLLLSANNTYAELVTTAGALITNATMSGDTINFCAIYPY
jgi:hypothetical protein